MSIAVEEAKRLTPILDQRIKHLLNDKKETLNDLQRHKEERIHHAGLIKARITELERHRHLKARMNTKTHFFLAGEKIGRYWTSLNKSDPPKDVIYILKRPSTEPASYEMNSSKMATIVREYHENLLTACTHKNERERQEAKHIALNQISPESRLTTKSKDALGETTDEDLVKIALKQSANFTSVGISSIPYEFWKMLTNMKQKGTSGNKVSITEILTKVFQDIEKNGVHCDSEFTKGWMCPLYKKKR